MPLKFIMALVVVETVGSDIGAVNDVKCTVASFVMTDIVGATPTRPLPVTALTNALTRRKP